VCNGGRTRSGDPQRLKLVSLAGLGGTDETVP
jgi:hypothetical protein